MAGRHFCVVAGRTRRRLGCNLLIGVGVVGCSRGGIVVDQFPLERATTNITTDEHLLSGSPCWVQNQGVDCAAGSIHRSSVVELNRLDQVRLSPFGSSCAGGFAVQITCDRAFSTLGPRYFRPDGSAQRGIGRGSHSRFSIDVVLEIGVAGCTCRRFRTNAAGEVPQISGQVRDLRLGNTAGKRSRAAADADVIRAAQASRRNCTAGQLTGIQIRESGAVTTGRVAGEGQSLGVARTVAEAQVIAAGVKPEVTGLKVGGIGVAAYPSDIQTRKVVPSLEDLLEIYSEGVALAVVNQVTGGGIGAAQLREGVVIALRGDGAAASIK